jgi:hypothetical protein
MNALFSRHYASIQTAYSFKPLFRRVFEAEGEEAEAEEAEAEEAEEGEERLPLRYLLY